MVLIIPNPIGVATCWYPTSAPPKGNLSRGQHAAHQRSVGEPGGTGDGLVAVDEQQTMIFSDLALIKADVNLQILNH